jgi:hypothetical protein
LAHASCSALPRVAAADCIEQPITDLIMRLTKRDLVNEWDRLFGAIRCYSRMYAPHAARESWVLFKVFQGILPADEYHELGEQFEE